MTPPKKGATPADAIYALAGEVAEMRGESRADHSSINHRLGGIEANQDLIRSAQQLHGESIAGIKKTCSAREKRISRVERSVRGVETNGAIRLGRRMTWLDLLKIFGALVAVGALIVAIITQVR